MRWNSRLGDRSLALLLEQSVLCHGYWRDYWEEILAGALTMKMSKVCVETCGSIFFLTTIAPPDLRHSLPH